MRKLSVNVRGQTWRRPMTQARNLSLAVVHCFVGISVYCTDVRLFDAPFQIYVSILFLFNKVYDVYVYDGSSLASGDYDVCTFLILLFYNKSC